MIFAGARDARAYGSRLAGLLLQDESERAYDSFLPYLTDKNPFRLLDIVAIELNTVSLPTLLPFLDQIAEGRFEGGWVLIATSLNQHIADEPELVFTRSAAYVRLADVWYAADMFGERIAGPHLLSHTENALALLSAWRADPDPWVRRVCGVAVHFWAKRTRGESAHMLIAADILRFLEPLLEEKDMRAAKGVGWGLKTMGRSYPETTAAWLRDQLHGKGRKPIAVVRRKALKFLPDDLKKDLIG